MKSGPILGLNYSGFHDSSAAVVDRDGSVIYATSLERLSRNKQDGRPPLKLLNLIKDYSISEIATSTNRYTQKNEPIKSVLFTTVLPEIRVDNFSHEDAFNSFFDSLDLPVTYVEHQESHAYSAIGLSGFESGVSLTYDGGMCNSNLFGSLAKFGDANQYHILDGFDYRVHPKITSFYSLITTLLGFMPNRHEGKVTGLSAHGKTSDQLLGIFENWFSTDFLRVERFAEWKFAYSKSVPPIFLPNYGLVEELRSEISQFSSTTIAATIQKFTENHILQLLKSAIDLNLFSNDAKICLSGGLFSNVRLNQKILQLGFSDIFVAPAMTDDGTALGAAISVVRKGEDYSSKNRPKNVYLGNTYNTQNVKEELSRSEINISKNHATDWKFITDRLLDGNVFAIFSGRSEFGPRALGNRSLIASPHDESINEKLNTKLQRTDFMPFAPVIRDVDYKDFFESTYNSSLPYMTITATAKKIFTDLCPAVVHVDGTARPQVLSRLTSPYLYDLISAFYENTGIPALINTSFNIHEEPIVNSPLDALRGFLVSEIDWLVFEGEYLISLQENNSAQLKFLRNEAYKKQNSNDTELIKLISKYSWNLEKELMLKEKVLQTNISHRDGRGAAINRISNVFSRRLLLKCIKKLIK